MFALRYTLTPLLAFILAINAQTPEDANGVFLVPGKNGSKCLTAASTSNGAQITIQPCANRSQLWTFEGGSIKLFANSNKCIDVKDGVDADGTKLQVWDCFPENTNQKFNYTDDKHIQWTNHDKCVDLTGGSVDNGNIIQVRTCVDCDPNQVWNTTRLID